MSLTFDIIECARGYQAEVSISAYWTAYTKCVKTTDQVEELCKQLADHLGRAYTVRGPS